MACFCDRHSPSISLAPLNVPQEAMSWWTNTDGGGRTLSVAHDQVMHFPPLVWRGPSQRATPTRAEPIVAPFWGSLAVTRSRVYRGRRGSCFKAGADPHREGAAVEV